MAKRAARRSAQGARRQRRCPLCGLLVSVAFPREEHERGQRCRAVRRVRELEARGWRTLPGAYGAALLVSGDAALVAAVHEDWTQPGPGEDPVWGYWVSDELADVLDACHARRETNLGFYPGYLTTIEKLPPRELRVLHAIACGDEGARAALSAALRLGGLDAALDLVADDDSGRGGQPA